MNRLLLTVSALALCAPAFAQTVYSPDARFQTSEGGGYAYYFGGYANGRFQLADGNLRNNVTIVTSLSYRHDNRIYSQYTGMGRSFTNVSLNLSDCDIATMTTNMSTNATSTPTLAFSGSVTWPTLDGQKTSTGWPVSFPCSVWVSNGTTDVLADYQFTGGTLANNYVWTSTSSRTYYLDSYRVGSYNFSTLKYNWNGKNVCLDSGQSSPRYNPYMWMSMYSYGPTYSTSSYKNKFRFYMYSYYTAPSAPVFHLLDFAGGSPGTPFPGVSCANLYVGSSPAMMIMPMMAGSGSAYSGYNYLGFTNGLIPFNQAAVGFSLYGQAAWVDSSTSALKLSIGGEIQIPALPPYTVNADAKRTCVRQYYPGATAYKYDYYYYNPITKYN